MAAAQSNNGKIVQLAYVIFSKVLLKLHYLPLFYYQSCLVSHRSVILCIELLCDVY